MFETIVYSISKFDQCLFCRKSYWIGLNDRATEGSMIWVNGTELSQSNFKNTNLPTKDCVFVDGNTWDMEDCNFAYGYVKSHR